MDDIIFPQLRPGERTAAYSERITQFVSKCPANTGRNSPYLQVVRSAGWLTNAWNVPPWRHQTAVGQYRVRMKLLRSEARNILNFLPMVELYNRDELEEERDKLLEDCKELIRVYDAVIAACQTIDIA